GFSSGARTTGRPTTSAQPAGPWKASRRGSARSSKASCRSRVRSLTVEEFARRLKDASRAEEKHYAIFLGAGCSVSSGIPDASTLVRERWLPRLRDLRAPNEDLTTWVSHDFPESENQRASSLYGKLI